LFVGRQMTGLDKRQRAGRAAYRARPAWMQTAKVHHPLAVAIAHALPQAESCTRQAGASTPGAWQQWRGRWGLGNSVHTGGVSSAMLGWGTAFALANVHAQCDLLAACCAVRRQLRLASQPQFSRQQRPLPTRMRRKLPPWSGDSPRCVPDGMCVMMAACLRRWWGLPCLRASWNVGLDMHGSHAPHTPPAACTLPLRSSSPAFSCWLTLPRKWMRAGRGSDADGCCRGPCMWLHAAAETAQSACWPCLDTDRIRRITVSQLAKGRGGVSVTW
jgi:hypothetical protein